MVKNEIMIIDDGDQTITLEELCEICDTSSDFIYTLIEYEIITPRQNTTPNMLFNVNQLKRLQTALRLQRDLEINLAGIVLVLDLLEQLEELREHKNILEEYLLR